MGQNTAPVDIQGRRGSRVKTTDISSDGLPALNLTQAAMVSLINRLPYSTCNVFTDNLFLSLGLLTP